jgi:hypothetical protein
MLPNLTFYRGVRARSPGAGFIGDPVERLVSLLWPMHTEG